MSWNNRLFDGREPTVDLLSEIDRLFDRQRRDWAAFGEGEASLASMQTKVLCDDGARVLVQSNPQRRKSTYANTDPESVAARKCFLCPENMPAEEQGIGFGPLAIVPNPYPVLQRHCTIPDRSHLPQRLEGRVGIMLELARRMGSDMLVLYNGPRSGASAPDHFHFQACQSSGVPLLDQLPNQLPVIDSGSRPVAFESFGRRLFVAAHADRDAAKKMIEQTVRVMGKVMKAGEEPMLNLLVWYHEEQFVSMLFPRARHRPSCYLEKGAGRLAISPAALEMAGVLVIAEPDQFEQITAETALRVYTEVSIDRTTFSAIERGLT